MKNLGRWYEAHPAESCETQLVPVGSFLYLVCGDCHIAVTADDVEAGNPVGGH